MVVWTSCLTSNQDLVYRLGVRGGREAIRPKLTGSFYKSDLGAGNTTVNKTEIWRGAYSSKSGGDVINT